MTDEHVARGARVRGRVQGVFFRASTRDRARRLGVTGWVRNEPDGTVSIHAEGDEADVAALLDWAREGPTHAVVVGVEVEDVEPVGHDDFDVRH